MPPISDAWPRGSRRALWGYLTLAAAALLLFTRRWTAPAAYLALLILELVKILIIVQDYRLRLNQHYMAFFVALAFLLFPAKRRTLQYLIVLFYFWAGTIKLNREWLSGASLYRREFLWLPDSLVPAACAYVVVLETILVFGLLARRPWIFWATLAQLALFHVMSWPIVGFFYPSLMFSILGIFALSRIFSAEPEERPSLARIERGLERRSTYALLAGFSLLQVVPYAFPGDSAITGEGRLFALHMFDAQVVCESHVTFHDVQGGSRRVRLTTGPGIRAGPLRPDRPLQRRPRTVSTGRRGWEGDGPRPVAPVTENDGARPPARRRDRGILPSRRDLRRLAPEPVDQEGLNDTVAL